MRPWDLQFLPCLLTDKQVQNLPPGSQLLYLPPQPLEHIRGLAVKPCSLKREGCVGIPAPWERCSADPLVRSDEADWHPGPGVPAFYAPRSIQMRNSACGQVVAAWPRHFLLALLGPWQP